LVKLGLGIIASTWILMNQKDPTGDDSAEGAHGRPPDLVLLLRGEVGSRGELGRWRVEGRC